MLALSLVTGGIGGVRNIGDAPLHVVIGGGLAGAVFIASLVWTIRALGVGGVDRGHDRRPARRCGRDRPLRLARRREVADHRGQGVGLVLLAVGTWLVIRE